MSEQGVSWGKRTMKGSSKRPREENLRRKKSPEVVTRCENLKTEDQASPRGQGRRGERQQIGTSRGRTMPPSKKTAFDRYEDSAEPATKRIDEG